MVWDTSLMAAMGVPAAMRPITGTSLACTGSTGSAPGGGPAGPSGRSPSITRRLRSMASGSRTTSMARARWARRWMKPRSSSAVMRRWMPDLDRRLSASFISSKEGGTPSRRVRAWMNSRSSICLRVSMTPLPAPTAPVF